jgi:hypothetical protein
MAPWLRSQDVLRLVPEWRFFAPIPGMGDFHLLYRDTYTGSTTDWTEIKIGDDRRWWNFLWHPRRREEKALTDAIRVMQPYLTPERIATAPLSVPYLTLLTYVSGLPRTLRPRQTQFLVMYSEAAIQDGQPQICLVSNIHELAE